MNENPELHSAIVAMVSLAAGIASRHPDMGLCQLDRLRAAGVPQSQIDTVIEIARHIRDEAAEKLDAAFDEKARLDKRNEGQKTSANERLSDIKIEAEQGCCSTTPSGQSCC